MTQSELNREVARATGEAEETIDQLGFVQLTGVPFELDNIVDWIGWMKIALPSLVDRVTAKLHFTLEGTAVRP